MKRGSKPIGYVVFASRKSFNPGPFVTTKNNGLCRDHQARVTLLRDKKSVTAYIRKSINEEYGWTKDKFLVIGVFDEGC